MAKLILSLLVALTVFAQTPSIEQSLGMKSVSGAQISPDGRFVAYTIQQANWEEDEFVQQIWVAMISTGERYQLTSAKKSSQNPKWSPDSKRLAFASERDGKRQIYVINPLGGEPQQLTTEENGVGQFEWAPDGTAVAFTSTGPESKVKKDRKDKYGDFEVVEGDYAMMRLWLVKTPEEIAPDPKQKPKAEALTEGDKFSVERFSWSPDSKLIAFSAQRDPDLSSSGTEQIYLVDLADKHVKKLLDSGGPNGDPRWSPDGRQIAFSTSSGDPFYYYTNRRIATIPASGGEPKILTGKFDEDAILIDWGPDGIYFSAFQKGAAHVFSVNPASLAIDRITSPDSFFESDASFTPDHRTMAAVGAMPNQFANVFVSSAKDFSPRYLTDMGDQWKRFQLTTREMIEWKSSDGTMIQGVLVKPRDYDPSRKYPLLVVIHGGPTGMDTLVSSADRYYPVERFAAKGALVLRPNYRGSAGLRREIPGAQRAQPRPGRLRGRDLGRRLSHLQGHGGQGSRGRYGLERGRLHFGLYHHL